ncbi:MAG: glycoside hydrolase family 16 protein [Lachnospiraceae bacterium]|nr:glycoside hydrolase family 16 protein [Lachnospiraceae bacterium]
MRMLKSGIALILALSLAGCGVGAGNDEVTQTFDANENTAAVVKNGEYVPDEGSHDFSNTDGDQADPGIERAGYKLVWSDEFGGDYKDDNVDPVTGLDLDMWSPQLGDGTTDCGLQGWGNNELQCYTADPANIGVNEDLDGDGQGDGYLRITAQYEEAKYKYADESEKEYTSARLRTTSPDAALFTTTYGYVEARIALPCVKGAWPAFWMLPESKNIYGTWPVSGEIDIMETTGINTEMACGTLHWGAPTHVYKGSGYVKLDSDISRFHTYAVNWEPGRIAWIYDGKEIAALADWESGFAGASSNLAFDAPFDTPFYLILNLAVDSGRFGGSDNYADFKGKADMFVDYVRVFKADEGYADSVVKGDNSDQSSDWKQYEGVAQIAPITMDCVVNDVPNGNVNAIEPDGNADPAKWYLAYQNDSKNATAEAVDIDGTAWAKVGVNSVGSQNYSTQLIGHYNAMSGFTYRISFDAFATNSMVGKKVNCSSKEWKGWSTFGTTDFELGAEPEHFAFYINQTDDFEDCRIEFNLGSVGLGEVYISNVDVQIVDPAEASEDNAPHKMLKKGNYIYNGDFSQGEGRVKYWETDDNTVINVPRFTTEALSDKDVKVMDVASRLIGETEDGYKYYERRAEITSQGDAFIYQPKMNIPAGDYVLTFDIKSDEDLNIEADICRITDKDVLTVKSASASAAYSAEDGLKSVELNISLKEDVEDTALGLRFEGARKVWLDNVSLKAGE